jgi:hypothetical protein
LQDNFTGNPSFRGDFVPRSGSWSERRVRKMPRVNLALVEDEMRLLAEERTKSVAGDAPMLTRSQTARIWGQSAAWVKTMQDAGRVPSVPWGATWRVPRAVVIIGLVKGL